MEKTDIGLHINRQLYNIMGADINVEKYLETTLELTRNCLKSSPGKYHVNLAGGGGKHLSLRPIYDPAVLVIPRHVSKGRQRC